MHKNAIWDRTTPHLQINCSLHVYGRIQGSQIFKRNSIISIRSKVIGIFSDFVVPMIPTLSPSSPRHPCCPHVIPIVPRRSPCGLHGCGLRGLHPMLSPSSPCHPRRPHVIPVSTPSCPHHPHSPQKVPMWSP